MTKYVIGLDVENVLINAHKSSHCCGLSILYVVVSDGSNADLSGIYSVCARITCVCVYCGRGLSLSVVFVCIADQREG